jgi:NADH-quinone oxidoreductase subunit L
MTPSIIDLAFPVPIVAHLVAALCLAGAWLVGAPLHERHVARISATATIASLLATITVIVSVIESSVPLPQVLSYGHWFSVAGHQFSLLLQLDGPSLTMLTLTSVIVGFIGAFSVRYLHREQGFFRFHVLIHVMAAGASIVMSAGSFDVVLVGWELLGISSAILVAFFEERPLPVAGAIRVFTSYRLADVGLLTGIVVLHHVAVHTTAFAALATVAEGDAILVTFLLLWGAAGKAALLLFSGWLPRAMEGPTPSSAVFYGALSVHAGAFLLLRAAPLFVGRPAAWLVIIVGGLTALWASNVARAVTDAKSAIALSTLTQLGLITIEIGCGLTTFALVHMVGNTAVRLVQLLRAPSVLLEHRQVYAGVGGALGPVGRHFRWLVPARVERFVYALSFDPLAVDHVVDRALAPLLSAAQSLDRLDQALTALLDGHSAPSIPADHDDDVMVTAGPTDILAGGRHD